MISCTLTKPKYYQIDIPVFQIVSGNNEITYKNINGVLIVISYIILPDNITWLHL